MSEVRTDEWQEGYDEAYDDAQDELATLKAENERLNEMLVEACDRMKGAEEFLTYIKDRAKQQEAREPETERHWYTTKYQAAYGLQHLNGENHEKEIQARICWKPKPNLKDFISQALKEPCND